jgi:hypothetical protein
MTDTTDTSAEAVKLLIAQTNGILMWARDTRSDV